MGWAAWDRLVRLFVVSPNGLVLWRLSRYSQPQANHRLRKCLKNTLFLDGGHDQSMRTVRVCVCVRTHIQCVHACMCVYVHTYSVCMRACVCTRTHASASVSVVAGSPRPDPRGTVLCRSPPLVPNAKVPIPLGLCIEA